MLKMYFICTVCRAEGEIDKDEITGMCPNCGDHHGGVVYSYDGNIEDFLNDLVNMSESQIAQNAMIIQLAAEGLLEEM